MTEEFFFYLFATLAIFGGISVVVSKNPVNAALFMILSLVSLAVLFLILEAFFLAALQILVYAGAVMVLFLFVIMLLNVEPEERARSNAILFVFAFIATSALVFVLLLWSGQGVPPPEVQALPSSDDPLAFVKGSKAFGYALLTKYMLPVQVSGFLLLVAMVGVILLARKRANKASEEGSGA